MTTIEHQVHIKNFSKENYCGKTCQQTGDNALPDTTGNELE